MVYYEDGSIDIVYTKDLLQFLQMPTRYTSPKDLPILEHVEPKSGGGKNRYETVAQAKTQQSSMLMHIMESERSADAQSQAQSGNVLVVTQYIPLPNFKNTASGDYEDLFQSMRTPIFFLIFIAVLLTQIFFKKRKDKKQREVDDATMGPLEKSLSGRGPSGQRLNEKQLKEIREIDSMLGDMGKLASDFGGGAQ